jgi:NO-binding membrane sensor protein with MHYT domain
MAFPIVLAWIASTFAADTKTGVGLGAVIAVTHAVGIAASNIYPDSESPQFFSGNMVSGVLGLVAAMGAVLVSLLLTLENRRRDRKYGRPETGVILDMAANADMHKDFRYAI